jgi:hypothetical protein
MALSLVQSAIQSGNARAPLIVEMMMQSSLIMSLLHFIRVDGQEYEYGEVAKMPGVTYRGVNEDYPATDYSIVNPKKESLRVFGGIVETDVRLSSGGGGNDARANEISRKMKVAAKFYERELLHGSGATQAKAITGLDSRVAAGSSQCVEAGTNGAQLTLSMLDDIIDRVEGENTGKVLILNRAMRRKVKTLAGSAATALTLDQVGRTIDTYDRVRIVTLDENDPVYPCLQFNEKQGSSNVTSSIWCLRPGGTTDGDGVQGLVQTNRVELLENGRRGTKWEDVVEMAAGLAVFSGRSVARLKGVLKPT